MNLFNKGCAMCYEDTRKYLTNIELFIGIRRNIGTKLTEVHRKLYKTMLLNIIYLLYSITFSMTSLPLRYLLQYFDNLSYKVTLVQFTTELLSFTTVSWIIIHQTFLNTKTMSKFLLQMNAIDVYLESSVKQHIYKEARNRNIIALSIIISFYLIQTCCSFMLFPGRSILGRITYRTVPLFCVIECVSFVSALTDIIKRIQRGNATLCFWLNTKYQNSMIINVNEYIMLDNENIINNIDEIIHFYSKIVNACALLNDIFYMPALLVFISNIGNIFVLLESTLYMSRSEDEVIVLALFLGIWGIHMLLCLVFICFTCEALNQQIHKARAFALKLVVYEKLPLNMQLRMEDLSHMLSMPGVGKFTVARLFTLNTSLLLNFLSFATTILIVVFQFYFIKKKE